MPTYGYQCTQCDNAFEIVQKMTDPALSICNDCGGELRKKIFPVGIAFKGSGFYVNDYASKSGAASAKADSPAADSSPSTDSAKADAKPESKTETAPAAAPAATAAPPTTPAATAN